MNRGKNDRQRISRRVVFTDTALAVGAAAAAMAITQKAAQVKISRSTANYQDTPKGDQRCENCANFQPPDACKFVEGRISPNGWCQLFVKKA